MILPPVPTGAFVFNRLFRHCDPPDRPHKIDDFDAKLREEVSLADMAGLGAFKYNDMWMLMLHNALSKKNLLKAQELKRKRKNCMILDPDIQELSFKVHWVLQHVPDRAMNKLYETVGKCTSVFSKKWRRSRSEEIEATTRVVSPISKEGVSFDDVHIRLHYLALTSWFLFRCVFDAKSSATCESSDSIPGTECAAHLATWMMIGCKHTHR